MEETPKKDWLKRLQNESWEPEILISGIVIYGLFKIFPYLEEFHRYLENYGSAFFRGTADDTAIALIQLSISWLIVGFITHLFLRSFWVAYIGLSYVYQNSINYKKLKYKTIYLKSLNKDNQITAKIEKLETICSSMFAISILFFMNVLGLIFFTCVVGFGVFLYIEIFAAESDFIYFDYFLQVILLICAIDYMTSGLFKRLPYVNKIFYPIYKVISFLTLAPLYRTIYYTFISNHNKWKVFLVLSIFIIASFFTMFNIRDGVGNTLSLTPSAFAENVMAPSNYLDEAEGEYSNVMWIPSQKEESQTLEAFVVHTPANEDNHIKPLCDYVNKVTKDSLSLGQIKLDCLDRFYELHLNENAVSAQFFYTKSNKTKQDGLKHFIAIDTLERGRHVLKLYYNYYNTEKDTVFKSLQSKIEFYKASSKSSDYNNP